MSFCLFNLTNTHSASINAYADSISINHLNQFTEEKEKTSIPYDASSVHGICSFHQKFTPPPKKKKKSVKHPQINPLRLELKGDIGPEVVLHSTVLETVFDLNLKRRKAEEMREMMKLKAESEAAEDGAGGETAEEEKFCRSANDGEKKRRE